MTAYRIVFMGATGAVGSAAFRTLLQRNEVAKILTLGRRAVDLPAPTERVEQQRIDVHDPTSYADYIDDYNVAVCTLGVGEPSAVPKADFIALDKTAVLNFARACKERGVRDFHLLSSVGADAKSMNYYLRTKGELNDALEALGFERLSIYRPSMILTPTNRYGFTQGIALWLWPKLDAVLRGKWRKYRGIPVAHLGAAIANNVFVDRRGVAYLEYDAFVELVEKPTDRTDTGTPDISGQR